MAVVNDSVVKTRSMKQYRFWLNVADDDEYKLAEECESLKANRGFAPTIRDGLRLILSLRRGEFDVLYELFPGIVDRVKNHLLEEAFAIIAHMAQEQEALRHEIAALRKQIGTGYVAGVPAKPPKAQMVSTQSAPGKGNAAQNLIKGITGLAK